MVPISWIFKVIHNPSLSYTQNIVKKIMISLYRELYRSKKRLTNYLIQECVGPVKIFRSLYIGLSKFWPPLWFLTVLLDLRLPTSDKKYWVMFEIFYRLLQVQIWYAVKTLASQCEHLKKSYPHYQTSKIFHKNWSTLYNNSSIYMHARAETYKI